MADLRQTIDLKQRLDELANTLAEDLCGNAIEDWHPIIRVMLTEAVRAALGEPSEAMIKATENLRIEQWDGNVSDLDPKDAISVWNAMAAARLKDIE